MREMHMLKGLELLNVPVKAWDTGESLAVISGLVVDAMTNRVLAFTVQQHHHKYDGSQYVLPWGGIQDVSPTQITARSSQMIVEMQQVYEIKRVMMQPRLEMGMRFKTMNGLNLGIMLDTFFDPVTGLVEGYEVEGGIFADPFTGRTFIPAPELVQINEQTAIITPETLQRMNHPLDKTRREKKRIQQKISKITEHTLKRFIGWRVHHAVRTPEGMFVAASGQLVTDRVLNRARDHNRVGALLKSISLTQTSLNGIAPSGERDNKKTG